MTTTAEPTITADRYRWTDAGRTNVNEGIRLAIGDEFYGLPNHSMQVRIVTPRTTAPASAQIIAASRDDVTRAGFNPDDWRMVYVDERNVERVTERAPEAPVLPLFQLNERGRRAWRHRVEALADGFYLVRRHGHRSTVAWPATRPQAGGSHPRAGGESWRELTAAGLNPHDFWVLRGDDGYFEPFTPPAPVDEATYPDPALAHLPLYRVIATQDSLHVHEHGGKLFRGVMGASGERHQVSILVPTAAATDPANGLTFMYGPGGSVIEAADLPRGTGNWRQYNIRAGRYEEVAPGTVSVTAEPVPVVPTKKMSKKELRKALEAVQAAHAADMEKVSARLEQEAVSRDWCGTYDAVIRDLSRDLTVPLRPRRVKTNKRVTFSLTYDRTDTLSLYDDLTPEQEVEEVQAWVRRNINAAATVENVRVQ